MSENIDIRKAKKEDFEQIHELIMQVYKIHVKNRGDIYIKDVDPLDFNMFKERLSNTNDVSLVAVKEKGIVGFCFAQIKKGSDNRIMQNRKVMNISDICVDKRNQGNGIGRRLYNEVLRLARKLKIDSIELMVWGFNSNAINFYENLGMEIKNIRFEKKIT